MRGAPKLANNPTWTPVVALRLVDAEGRWLMHRRPDDKHHGGLWEFPGGKVESGESPKAALVREISEELGIEISDHSLQPVAFSQTDDDNPIVILLYTSNQWRGTPQCLEGGAVGWFNPREARELRRPPLDIALMRLLADP